MNVNVIFKNRIPQNSIEKIGRGTQEYRIWWLDTLQEWERRK